MKFALVDGIRREAEKGLTGTCIGCGNPSIPKCGLIKTKHWAHKSKFQCDRWYETKGEWHLAWQNNFPLDWQEIRHLSSDGEWHIADVKTDKDWVIEFQRSPISIEERLERNKFYQKIVWVVDGLKYPRDEKQFYKSFQESSPISRHSAVLRVPSDRCMLFTKWCKSRSAIFLDFGFEDLWCVHPVRHRSDAFIHRLERIEFLDMHLSGEPGEKRFNEFLAKFNEDVSTYINKFNADAKWLNWFYNQKQLEEARRKMAYLRRRWPNQRL